MRSISQASGALHELARLLPSTAQRLIGETIDLPERCNIAATRASIRRPSVGST
jgi:hypothetical protein